jgi:hypothetical protein
MTEAVLEKQEQKVAFASRNANQERITQEEEELKNLIDLNKEGKPTPTGSEDDSNLNAEEKTFKKRYGDLRSHSQKQQVQLQKEIDDLRSQLQKSTTNQIKLPTSEEDLAAWANEYPEVARIVETIAIKKAKEQSAELADRFKVLDEREQQTARDKAEAELLRIHPDFESIKESDEFHTWVEEQPTWIQNALYENDSDAKSAARAIDLYKADKGIGKAKKSDNKGAAESVSTRSSRSAPSNMDSEGVIYESQVNAMNSHQYEANQEAISKAIKSGKFVYDLSGNAR